jgi:predicted ribosomally synthesized peptide with nif11-like leader
MSLASAESFILAVNSDGALAQQLAEANSGAIRQGIARCRGFEFTREEFELAKSRLSDEELASLAVKAYRHGPCDCPGGHDPGGC